MKKLLSPAACMAALALSPCFSHAEIKTTVEHRGGSEAKPGFAFKNVPPPAKNDAAAKAKFTLVDGEPDRNGGNLDKLHDGATPTEADEPSANFFFLQGTDGGRIEIDLGNAIDIKQINTYSWHTDTRAPQVYTVYASDGKTAGFNAEPKRGSEPEQFGWKLIAKVDTRKEGGEEGGQHGVSIFDTAGAIGHYQYLLFDISQTEKSDPFGNTFYSEIDIIDKNAPAPTAVDGAAVASVEPDHYTTDGGEFQFTIMTADAPDLTDWTRKILAPTVQKWYPEIVKMMPSPGFDAPKKFSIEFTNQYHGVAATGGTHIMCDPTWYRNNILPKGQGPGSVVHELVHVVQQYGRARRNNPKARTPGWLVEGIPDYIRWFLYEPESHGADINARGLPRAKYDGMYRISANFLNWATDKYDKELVWKVNVALRGGTYDDTETWKSLTHHSLDELNEEWRQSLASKLGVTLPAPPAPAPPTAATTNPAPGS